MPEPIRAKKHLGQHFLHDKHTAQKIVGCLSPQTTSLLEIGPGTGILTSFILEKNLSVFKAIDIDSESVEYLRQRFEPYKNAFLLGDFLTIPLHHLFDGPLSIIGNFPYNISSQIFFRILAHHRQIPEVVCMVQKEVAQRIASPAGNRDYGILSVLLQAWYKIEYLFTVNEGVFTPPPKVKSGVIRLTHLERSALGCDEEFFVRVVKTAFNQRRKTLRNALKPLVQEKDTAAIPFLDQRAEQLSVSDFVRLAQRLV